MAGLHVHCANNRKDAPPPANQNQSNNILNQPTGQISGVVTRSNTCQNSCRGTLCVAIGTSCLAMNTYQTFHGIDSVAVANVDFTGSEARAGFNFASETGKLTPGSTYYIIATLQEGSGNCWMSWKKNDLFTWQDSSGGSPCASFTYQEGKQVSGLAVTLNGLIPFDYTVDPSQTNQTH